MLTNKKLQQGATLIEVLVSLLLLSIGAVALNSMLMVTVNLPKLAGYRATAVNLANSYVERMRANTSGFELGSYQLSGSSYANDTTQLTADEGNLCEFPECSAAGIAAMDFEVIRIAARAALPAGGIFMLNDASGGAPSQTTGNLWVIWNEPSTTAWLDASRTDNCPDEALAFENAQTRCVYVRFNL
jgi:type IV pilus assembly protein PilV